MSHAYYVYASWGISMLTLAGLVVGAAYQSRRLQNDLKRLEAQGIRRRSDPQPLGDKA